MRLPRRSVRSIQPLPSILTTFPIHYNRNSSRLSANEKSRSDVEEGIEVVPIERSNISCVQTITPDSEEKEVVTESLLARHIIAKPLPIIPIHRQQPVRKTWWNRLSVKQRIWLLICIQLILVLISIGCLVSTGRNHDSKPNDESSTISSLPGNLPIKMGRYALPLGNTRQESSACLAKNNESVLWSCSDTGVVQIDLFPAPAGQAARTLVALGLFASSNQSHYGQQPAEIIPVELMPGVNSKPNSNGSVYYFRAVYNRTVLRAGDRTPGKQGAAVLPGERPWLCVFNETVIEGSIHVFPNSTYTNRTMASVLGNTTVTDQLPVFPYTFKLKEQRYPNGKQPYCERKALTENGELVPSITDNGSEEKISIDLSEPTSSLELARRNEEEASSNGQEIGQAPITNPCVCKWVVQR